jgi:hypothetical protein
MRSNPASHPVPIAAQEASRKFDISWSRTLQLIEEALSGQPVLLTSGLHLMTSLRDQVLLLMRIPVPGTNMTVGPSFNYVAKEEWLVATD